MLDCRKPPIVFFPYHTQYRLSGARQPSLPTIQADQAFKLGASVLMLRYAVMALTSLLVPLYVGYKWGECSAAQKMRRKKVSSKGSIDASQVVEFLKFAGDLKRTRRTGWVLREVKEAESVADHSFRMSCCCFLLGACKETEDLDWMRCALMCILHDIGEAVTGDFTPHDNISAAEKYKLEHEAVCKIFAPLQGNAELHRFLFDLWLEYEKRSTKEALLVKDLDRFEMMLQALEYERDQGVDLSEFFKVHSLIKSNTVASWASQILKLKSNSDT